MKGSRGEGGKESSGKEGGREDMLGLHKSSSKDSSS